MYSKLVTALIILTVAALCAAAAFQYLEMESFGLPKTLQERFFPAAPPAAAEDTAASESGSENTQNAAGDTAGSNTNSENAPAAQE